MRKLSQIKATAEVLNNKLFNNFNNYFAINEEKLKGLDTKGYEEARVLLSELMYDAEALIGGCYDENLHFPKYLYSFKTYEDNGKLSEVEITIKSKLKDEFKFKETKAIKADDNFVENFRKFHTESIFALYYMDCATENLKEVNEVIKEICTTNELGYTFEFTLGRDKEYITRIDNETVVFNADLQCALEVGKKGLFQGGDSYLDVVRQGQIDKLVETLSTVQTTTQLIKADIDIINFLVGYTTRRRADRLIRKAYHKQALHFNRVNAGYGYFEKELEDGTSIFAILEKTKDGNIEVSLRPFNIKTLEAVDYDVVAEVEKALA